MKDFQYCVTQMKAASSDNQGEGEAKKDPSPKKKAAAAPKKKAPPKKKRNPLDLLPKSKLNINEWKKVITNEDSREKAIPWFWEHYEEEGWSLWFADYKYNDELTMDFMALNLLTGFCQRLDTLRKYGFGVMVVFGEDNNLEIGTCWLLRGKEIPAEVWFQIVCCYSLLLTRCWTF